MDRYWCEYCGSYAELDKAGRCEACGAPYRKPEEKQPAWSNSRMISSDYGGQIVYDAAVSTASHIMWTTEWQK